MVVDDRASEAPANHELHAVKAVHSAGVTGLHTPLATIVEYMGVRILAQSLIPGILLVTKCSRAVTPLLCILCVGAGFKAPKGRVLITSVRF